MFRSIWFISKEKKEAKEKDYGPNYKTLRHFDKKDFACPCCGKNDMPLWFMQEIDDCRHQCGFPWIITSGVRCEKHNKNIEGSKTSSHLKSIAVDIYCIDSNERWKMIEQLKIHGFKRIGIGENFIHADKDKDKNGDVIWVY